MKEFKELRREGNKIIYEGGITVDTSSRVTSPEEVQKVLDKVVEIYLRPKNVASILEKWPGNKETGTA